MGTSTWRDKLKRSQSKQNKSDTKQSTNTSTKAIQAKSNSRFSFTSKKKIVVPAPPTTPTAAATIEQSPTNQQDFSPEPILPALTPTSQASALGIVPVHEQRFTAIITGGSSGVGYYAAKQLAIDYPNSTIIIASRNGESAVDQLRKEVGRDTGIYFAPLDLSSQSSIRQFVSEWKSHRYPYIHYLLLNAGANVTNEYNDIIYSEDGVEYNFAVNYLGHYLLYQLLRPCLAPHARIVVTTCNTNGSSNMPAAVYTNGRTLALPEDAVEFEEEEQKVEVEAEVSYQQEKEIKVEEISSTIALRRYTTSKLALIYFANELYERLQLSGSKQSVIIYDAGYVVGTKLNAAYQKGVVGMIESHVYPWITPLLRWCGTSDVQTANQAGKNLATIALDRAVVYSGAYYNCNINSPSDDTSNINTEHQADLWKSSAALTANSAIEVKRFELV